MTTSEVLRAIRIKGLASAEVIAELSGLAASDVEAELSDAGDAGLIERKDGRIAGWRLTPEGRSQWRAALSEERAALPTLEQLSALYTGTFLGVNLTIKEICTAWQLRPGRPGEMTVNDHSDRSYDASVIARLAALHRTSIVPLVDQKLSECLPRLSRYRYRLDSAVLDVEGGEHRRFTAPMANSYHDIWMELHEDLVLLIGVDRKAEEVAGS